MLFLLSLTIHLDTEEQPHYGKMTTPQQQFGSGYDPSDTTLSFVNRPDEISKCIQSLNGYFVLSVSAYMQDKLL